RLCVGRGPRDLSASSGSGFHAARGRPGTLRKAVPAPAAAAPAGDRIEPADAARTLAGVVSRSRCRTRSPPGCLHRCRSPPLWLHRLGQRGNAIPGAKTGPGSGELPHANAMLDAVRKADLPSKLEAGAIQRRFNATILAR